MSAPTWSLADTHCVWCGKPRAGKPEFDRHEDGDGPCYPTEEACWCNAFCWLPYNAFSCQPDRDAIATRLRGLVEAQASVIARYREGWRTTAGKEWRLIGSNPGVWEPMTPAEQQVLYGTTSEEASRG